jgi:hypothetical protein
MPASRLLKQLKQLAHLWHRADFRLTQAISRALRRVDRRLVRHRAKIYHLAFKEAANGDASLFHIDFNTSTAPSLHEIQRARDALERCMQPPPKGWCWYDLSPGLRLMREHTPAAYRNAKRDAIRNARGNKP